MNIVTLILGIVFSLFAVITVFVSVLGTPNNLRGFYGKKYILIGIGALIAGIVLIVISFI